MEEKIKALVEDQVFVNKTLSCQEPEQVQALFAENGVELSLEEVKAIGQGLAAMSESDGELNEDDLEGVAGGSLKSIMSQLEYILHVDAPRAPRWSDIKRFFTRW